MAATTAVFETVELFEQILSFITIEELTRAQRVCRAWQDSIMASPELKRTLHFELQPGAVIPLLRRDNVKFRHCKKGTEIVFETTPDCDPGDLQIFSDYSIIRFAPPVRVRTEKRWHVDERGHRRKDEWHPVIVDVRDLLLRPPGAWEMLRLSQPSWRNLALEFSVAAAIGQSGEDFWDHMHLLKVDLKNPEGIRIGDLTETVRSRMRDYEAETGEKVCMTSYCDANFVVPGHAFEGSKDVRRAFRQFREPPPPTLGLEDLRIINNALDEEA